MKQAIVVTGANKGIGFAICQQILIEHSNTFVFLGSRDLTRGDEAVTNLIKDNKDKVTDIKERIQLLHLDVTDENSIIKASETVANKVNSIEGMCLYGLVNNAGVYHKDFSYMLKVNYYGALLCSKHFSPILKKCACSAKPRIVNISSGAASMYAQKEDQKTRNLFDSKETTLEQIEELILLKTKIFGSNEEMSAYGFTKACLNTMTMQLAKEYNNDIIVSACSPGYIATDLTLKNGMNPTLPPVAGTKCPLKMLFEKLPGNGYYFGSDGLRSPLVIYRGVGDPEFQGHEKVNNPL